MPPQWIMAVPAAASDENTWPRELTSVPSYISLASAFVVLVQITFSSPATVPATFSWKQTAAVVARVVGCLAMFGLSAYINFTVDGLDLRSPQTQRLFTDAYASILALGFMSRFRRPFTHHLNVVLFATFSVYAYRDLLPLATFHQFPRDGAEGWMLWARVGVLFVVGFAVTLLVPREYVPVDPENPMSTPNQEQTDSVLSLLLYQFLNPIIGKSRRVEHLPYDELPPLADSDRSEYLKRRSFTHLDVFYGAKSRHLAFGLLRVFLWDWCVMTLFLLGQVAGDLASPIGINQLLRYLETGGEGAVYRPWFWIAWIFFGPVLAAVSFERYVFLATKILVRVQGIVTELVFEHSLRIRIKAETESDEKSSNLIGKINNLATSDLDNIGDGKYFLRFFVYTPITIAFCILLLYRILGWSAFVGLGVIIVTSPIPGFFGNSMQKIFKRRMGKLDARVQAVTETLSVIRMVKMFGWEKRMEGRITEKRHEEMSVLMYQDFVSLVGNILNSLIPICTMIATYATQYTIIMGEQLNASKVFSSMAIFNMFSEHMKRTIFEIVQLTGCKASLDRLTDFLHNTELLDSYSGKEATGTGSLVPDEHIEDIGFRNAKFAWSNESEKADGSLKPSSRDFGLAVDDVIFKKGTVNLVVGPTGCGKTSLLMALLGEMHYLPTEMDSWYNLPRRDGIAYAAQESWVLNTTIRENILFGSEYNEDRYKDVIKQCALERDLTLFDAGDETEVGEKGLTLSGGQKARVTLARAIYSSASILMLDDVLAALDVHTAKWIVDRCLAGPLMTERTVILVTHNIAIVNRVARYVVAMKDGKITEQGSYEEVVKMDASLLKEVAVEEETLRKAEDETSVKESETDKSANDGKLIVQEEVAVGLVSWAAFKIYLKAVGGSYPITFFVGCIGSFIVKECFVSAQTWYLGLWASQYDTHASEDVNALHYIGIYSLLLLVGFILFSIGYTLVIIGAIRASKVISRQLMSSVLGTTLRWLDKTPTSRIIARCTQDLKDVDGSVANFSLTLLILSSAMVIQFFSVVIYTPIFLVFGTGVAILGGLYAQIYVSAQLSVKREMSTAKAPVLAHFGAAINGLTSIRAYGVQATFIKESLVRIDRYTRPARTCYNINRWIAVRAEALGAGLSAMLAIYLVYVNKDTASHTGFSLNMAVAFSSSILWWVRFWNELQVSGNSLERIQQYLSIEQEPRATKEGEPPAYWPASGSLTVEKLSARYSPDGPDVLHDVSFEVKSGERVGVVGRTGSGKSSLTLSLLRCIPTSPPAAVRLDGISTSDINLDALRTKITIIPQVRYFQPELLSGTIRANLDPFEEHDDIVLNDALRSSGLFALQEQAAADVNEAGRITLETSVSSGGGNLSIGQRQILALARALVRKSRVLILDEATSAIDYETDGIIQRSLRELSRSDVTVITIAHRLQTVMDADRIMVLDEGHLVEYDSPMALLSSERSKLRALVDASSDAAALYEMAGL